MTNPHIGTYKKKNGHSDSLQFQVQPLVNPPSTETEKYINKTSHKKKKLRRTYDNSPKSNKYV